MSHIQLDDILETFLDQIILSQMNNFGPNQIVGKFKINEIQREILCALINNDKNIIKKSRRVGCTTILLLYATYRAACYQENILFQLPNQRMIQFAMSQLLFMIKDSFIDVFKVKDYKVTFLQKNFNGGGSITFSAKNNHSDNFDVIVFDEATYYSNNIFLNTKCRKVTVTFSDENDEKISDKNCTLQLWEKACAKTTNYHPTYVPWYKDPITACDFLNRFSHYMRNIS